MKGCDFHTNQYFNMAPPYFSNRALGNHVYIFKTMINLGLIILIPSGDILSTKSKYSTGFDVRPTLLLD